MLRSRPDHHGLDESLPDVCQLQCYIHLEPWKSQVEKGIEDRWRVVNPASKGPGDVFARKPEAEVTVVQWSPLYLDRQLMVRPIGNRFGGRQL